MQQLNYCQIVEVSALPTASVNLIGVIVQLSSNGACYYCDGSTWTKLAEISGAANTITFDAGAWKTPRFGFWSKEHAHSQEPTAVFGYGLTALAPGGSQTPTPASPLSRLLRVKWGTSATVNNFVSMWDNRADLFFGQGIKGGFFYSTIFGPSDAATVSTAIQFCGLAPGVGYLAVAQTSARKNCVGIGHDSGAANLSFYYAGSAVNTPINLGSNFPANTLGTEAYQLVLYAPKDPTADGFNLGWYVKRLGTEFTASGTLNATVGTQLPSAAITSHWWRCNDSTAAVVSLDVVQYAAIKL